MTSSTLPHRFDFIGDIHGHGDELIELLEKLGYENTSGFYKHETRKAFFCGDFIDRGPQIKEVLQLVKGMTDNGSAYTVIGNHEYNAICYHTFVNGQPLRPHSPHNNKQHRKTLEALSKNELKEYINWFKSLPIYYDNGNFRIVHAQWEESKINQLVNWNISDFSSDQFLIDSANKSSAEYSIVDCLLKGKEVRIPEVYFTDKDGKRRDAYRIKWWKQGIIPCKEALFEFPQDNDRLMNAPIEVIKKGVPVFFGHYWLKEDKPVILSANACCLDYSVAKGGVLAAYRWNGESELNSENFYWVGSKEKS